MFDLEILSLAVLAVIILSGKFDIWLKFFITSLKAMLPALPLVFILYVILEKIKIKALPKKGQIIISAIFGVISTGPIYFWYPVLEEQMKKGMRHGSVAAFLYARGIKPALLPIMVNYLGLKFTVLFNILMFIAAVLSGYIFEWIWRWLCENSNCSR